MPEPCTTQDTIRHHPSCQCEACDEQETMCAPTPTLACQECKSTGRQATIASLDAPDWLPRPDTRDMIVSGVRDCPTCHGTGRR